MVLVNISNIFLIILLLFMSKSNDTFLNIFIIYILIFFVLQISPKLKSYLISKIKNILFSYIKFLNIKSLKFFLLQNIEKIRIIILSLILYYLIYVYLVIETLTVIDSIVLLVVIILFFLSIPFKNFLAPSLISIFSAYIGLFIANSYFTYSEFNDLDRMTKFRAYQEMIKENPSLLPWTGVFKPSVDNKFTDIVLSNKSNNDLLFCNESGEWITYLSDKFGFNNNNKLFDNKKISLFLGDSFVEGMCVNRKDNLVSNLSSLTNEPIINLGMSGTALIEQFLILKRYYKNFNEIKKIFWMYSETNDLFNIDGRIRNDNITMDILDNEIKNVDNTVANTEYFILNKDKTIVEEINNFISSAEGVNKWQSGQVTYNDLTGDKIYFKNLISLELLRDNADLAYKNIFFETSDNSWRSRENETQVWFKDHHDLFLVVEDTIEKLFKEIKNFSIENDIEIVFIYNPMWETVGPITNYAKPYVLEMASEYFSKVIDLEEKLDTYSDDELFVNGQNSHYSESGYKIVSKEIYKSIK